MFGHSGFHFHFRWEGGLGTRKSENTSTPSSNEAMATPRGAEQSTSVHQTRDTAARASERRWSDPSISRARDNL